MRKILAGLLATSMIVSMATMASAATVMQNAKLDATVSSLTTVKPAEYTATGNGKPHMGNGAAGTAGTWTANYTVDSVTVEAKAGATVLGTFTVPIGKTGATTIGAAATVDSTGADDKIKYADATVAAADLVKLCAGATFHDVKIGEVYYSGELVVNSAAPTVLTVQFTNGGIPGLTNDSRVTVNVSFSNAATNVTYFDTGTLVAAGTSINPGAIAPATPVVTGASLGVAAGTIKETIETEKDGDMLGVNVSDILTCYPDGSPIPLTEKDTGADKDLNGNGGVQSGQTLYFMVRDDSAAHFDKLEDDSFWKMKISKSNNGKYVKSVEDVTKIFSSDLYDANKLSTKVPGTGDNKRHRYIKVVLNEIYTDDEYKIGLDVRLTATDAAVRTGIVTKDETLLKVKDFNFWMKNIVKSADNDWVVGITGLMLNPMLNDWNNVTYMDEVDDVAFVRFFGDSDVGKFYAKLSTKWTHDDYAAYFNDQDAFYFEFTGSPKISSTSRADLQIYDPFTDIDGNSTFDASTATIYQIVDGDLIDVTDSFTYGEGENGENAFITRTRFLGSYIICEKPVDEAVGEEDIDDLMPDEEEIPVAPITPDTNAGGKNPANTGRYN